MTYRLGVVDVVFWKEPDPVQRALRAKELGFEHIDVNTEVDPASLSLPVGCPTAFPKPQPGWCSTPAPRDEPGRHEEIWERTVRWFRRSPGALLEPWAGAVVNSLESAKAMMAEVPGLRLLVDTGHVSDWGGTRSRCSSTRITSSSGRGSPARPRCTSTTPPGWSTSRRSSSASTT